VADLLNELAHRAHENAVRHGFWSHGLAFGDRIALLHEELSELYNAWRKGRLYDQCDKSIGLNCAEEELADVLIRALDLCETLGVDAHAAILAKMKYNESRPHLHGDAQCPGEIQDETLDEVPRD